MATKAKAPKAKATITAPAIKTAWLKVVETTAKNEAGNIKAIETLVVEMRKSALSIRDIQAVIKDTKRESAVLKVSHIEGLITWSDMRAKFADFAEAPLANQLSLAVASYKLLGAGNATKLPSLEVVKTETANARKAKNDKTKAPKTAKAKTTNKEVLQGFLTYLNALNAETLTDTEMDILSDISIRIIELEPINA